jgi:UPF0716 protein FxsA
VLLPLVILFIAVPIVELYVLLQVGSAIGVLPTIALLIADSVLGSMLMRSQGRAAWRRFNAALAEGRVPGREVVDGALIIFGGALLLTPGFFTDVFGLLFLLPPTRAVVRRLLLRHFAGRVVTGVVGGAAARAGRVAYEPRAGDDPRFDVEGRATEVDPRRGELP